MVFVVSIIIATLASNWIAAEFSFMESESSSLTGGSRRFQAQARRCAGSGLQVPKVESINFNIGAFTVNPL